MKYCTFCGTQIMDDAVFCPHCGCAVTPQQKSESSGLKTAAFVLMIISCVACGLNLLLIFPIFGIAFMLGGGFGLGVGIILSIFYVIFSLSPIAWMIPMTVHYRKCVKNGTEVGLAFKICTLLFVNVISGILMLIDSD